MSRMRKTAISLGVFAVLLGAGVNMRVSALTPKETSGEISEKIAGVPKSNKLTIKLSMSSNKKSDSAKKGVKSYSSCEWDPGKTDAPGKHDYTAITIKNSTLYPGDKWEAKDNLYSVIGSDGSDLPPIESVKVEGSVDTSKTGVYKVTYSRGGICDRVFRSTATITVKEDETSLKVKDSIIYDTAKWQASDNLVRAVNKAGNEVGIKGVTTSGNVDIKKEGDYKVTYKIVDHYGKEIMKDVIVTVKVDQSSLEVKDSALYVGDEWNPEDNVIKAIDKDGKVTDIKDIEVKRSIGDVDDVKRLVDTSKVGKYEITYTMLNGAKNKVSKKVIIEVKKDTRVDKTSLGVKDSAINIGAKWQPSDNLIKATDKDRKNIDIKDIDVKGSVDTNKVGKYKITYTIADRKDKKIVKKAVVTVIDSSPTLPKTGADISMIGSLLGLGGFLGLAAIYLKRRQRLELGEEE